jgi:hypothetical protein
LVKPEVRLHSDGKHLRCTCADHGRFDLISESDVKRGRDFHVVVALSKMSLPTWEAL